MQTTNGSDKVKVDYTGCMLQYIPYPKQQAHASNAVCIFFSFSKTTEN